MTEYVDTIKHLGEISRTYQVAADAYAGIATAAAEAEAGHKSARARTALRFKDSGDCRSMAEAEARAEADDEVSGLYRERLIKAALADAARMKLLQLREQVSTGRTCAATQRETDRMHADGYGGGA